MLPQSRPDLSKADGRLLEGYLVGASKDAPPALAHVAAARQQRPFVHSRRRYGTTTTEADVNR